MAERPTGTGTTTQPLRGGYITWYSPTGEVISQSPLCSRGAMYSVDPYMEGTMYGYGAVQMPPQPVPEDPTALQDIDRIIARLDVEIPEAQKAMDALLSRLRTTRIVA